MKTVKGDWDRSDPKKKDDAVYWLPENVAKRARARGDQGGVIGDRCGVDEADAGLDAAGVDAADFAGAMVDVVENGADWLSGGTHNGKALQVVDDEVDNGLRVAGLDLVKIQWVAGGVYKGEAKVEITFDDLEKAIKFVAMVKGGEV